MNSQKTLFNEPSREAPGKVFFIDCETDLKKFSVLNELLFIQVAVFEKKVFQNIIYEAS